MNVTEDHLQANTMRCPFVDGGCIGSKCMAWRWMSRPNPTSLTTRSNSSIGKIGAVTVEDFKRPEGEGWEPDGEPYPPPPDGHEGKAWKMDWKRSPDLAARLRDGYCGLAGAIAVWPTP